MVVHDRFLSRKVRSLNSWAYENFWGILKFLLLLSIAVFLYDLFAEMRVQQKKSFIIVTDEIIDQLKNFIGLWGFFQFRKLWGSGEVLWGKPSANQTGIDSGLEAKGIGSNMIIKLCLLYTSPSPRDQRGSRMPSSA